MTDRVLEIGSAARLVALVGEVATVETGEPHPVGARVVLRDETGTAASGKIVEASRCPDGYRLRVRLFSPSSAVRTALAARVVAAPGPGSSRPDR
ncbi:MAG: hypothetical protein GYA57_18730 [Myxococcales bacterium]|nr:hypothetical protein [Myxococcales bacterium]